VSNTPEPTNEAVHAMCGYLRSCEDTRWTCLGCPSKTETAYGPGELGCYGIALETLEKAREFDRRASPVASPDEMEAALDAIGGPFENDLPIELRDAAKVMERGRMLLPLVEKHGLAKAVEMARGIQTPPDTPVRFGGPHPSVSIPREVAERLYDASFSASHHRSCATYQVGVAATCDCYLEADRATLRTALRGAGSR
jgi:hypothetical protein